MDTSKVSDIELLNYKGFESITDQCSEDRWETLYEGYRYEDTLLEDNSSRYLQRNPTIRAIFPYFNRILSNLINSVKFIRNFNNYAVRKDYKRIN